MGGGCGPGPTQMLRAQVHLSQDWVFEECEDGCGPPNYMCRDLGKASVQPGFVRILVQSGWDEKG